LISAAFHSREPLGAQVGDQGVCRPFEAAGLDQIGHCAHLVDVRLGGEYRSSLGHSAHLCFYSGHHVHRWCTTLGVLFVQLSRRLDHRVEFLGPLVAVCCAFYPPPLNALASFGATSSMEFSMDISFVITPGASS
jgi:hypothetical protein